MSSVTLSHASNRYALGSLPTPVLVRQLDELARQELHTDADVLAHIAELDVREHYRSLGFSSMHDYCVRRLRMSEDRANKRIRACRTALEYPIIFTMLSDGRLSATAVLLLKARLTPENSRELLAAAASLSTEALELMLAKRFPRAELVMAQPALALTSGIAGNSGVEVAARPPLDPSGAAGSDAPVVPVSACDAARDSSAQRPALHAKFTPLSGECVALRGQLSLAAYEHFQRVRALASHAVPSGNAALVIEYALKLAADLLDRKKFGRGVRTHPRNGEPNGRYVPAAIRQAVCERDGGRCTFTAPDGTRCGSEWRLELDHIVPLAQGGKTTVDNLRSLCGPHNRHEAKRILGASFVAGRIERAHAERMRARHRKTKQEALRAGAERSGGAQHSTGQEGAPADAVTHATPGNEASPATEPARDPAAQEGPATHAPDVTSGPPVAGPAPRAIEADVIAALRSLRLTLAEAKRGVEITAHMVGASAEQRVRVALQYLGRANAHRTHRVSRNS